MALAETKQDASAARRRAAKPAARLEPRPAPRLDATEYTRELMRRFPAVFAKLAE